MISTKETSLAIAWDECFLPHPLGAFRIINHQCRRILHIYMMEMTPLHGVRHMRCRIAATKINKTVLQPGYRHHRLHTIASTEEAKYYAKQ